MRFQEIFAPILVPYKIFRRKEADKFGQSELEYKAEGVGYLQWRRNTFQEEKGETIITNLELWTNVELEPKDVVEIEEKKWEIIEVEKLRYKNFISKTVYTIIKAYLKEIK